MPLRVAGILPAIRGRDALGTCKGGTPLPRVLGLIVVSDGQVHHAGRVVEQGPSGLEGDLHVDQHVAYGGQLLDGDGELLAAGRIVAGDPVRGLGNPERLGGDADPGPVHQGGDVRHETSLPLADQLARACCRRRFRRWASRGCRACLRAGGCGPSGRARTGAGSGPGRRCGPARCGPAPAARRRSRS